MPTDFYETEVRMPRWELRDFFGRGAIRKARWEYTQMKRERDALKNELEAVLTERGKAVDKLIDVLAKERAETAELRRRLQVCDEARKSLGDKLNTVTEELENVRSLNRNLVADLSMAKAKLEGAG